MRRRCSVSSRTLPWAWICSGCFPRVLQIWPLSRTSRTTPRRRPSRTLPSSSAAAPAPPALEEAAMARARPRGSPCTTDHSRARPRWPQSWHCSWRIWRSSTGELSSSTPSPVPPASYWPLPHIAAPSAWAPSSAAACWPAMALTEISRPTFCSWACRPPSSCAWMRAEVRGDPAWVSTPSCAIRPTACGSRARTQPSPGKACLPLCCGLLQWPCAQAGAW
mmetsp:Transcript_92387/g.298585  ORF Transcript_92387/g.298585 Transcript_92387/m.298585 type:complete len:221 (+) Transcript_92387:142-804(+)